MAKGLAVISGSNTVVFKALETGVVKMGGMDGSVLKPASVTISGSLTLSGSEGVHLNVSGSEFRLDNLSGLEDQIIISGSTSEDGSLRGGLAWNATSSKPPNLGTELEPIFEEAPDDFITIDSDGHLARSNKITARSVVLDDGTSMEEKLGNAKIRLVGTSVLGGVTGSEVSLTRGDLEFVDVANRTRVTVAQDDESNFSSSVTIDLDPNVKVETLSASMGLEVTGSSVIRGDLHVVADAGAGLTGDATIDGKLTVKGNLDVLGDINQVTINQSNLSIEDAIILVGSGSDGTQGELGFIFGTEGANNSAFTLKDGDFYLGKTTDNAADDDISPDNDGLGKLVLANLSASAYVDALDLRVHDTATITGKLDANADVDLGADADSVVKIFGTLTASAPARFQGAINVDSGADVTLEAGSDLTLVQGDLTLSDGDLTVSGVSKLSASLGAGSLALDVDGKSVLSSSAGVDALHVQGGDVLIDENLTVQNGVVTLGNVSGELTSSLGEGDMAGTISWKAGNDPSLDVKGGLNVEGSVLLGNSADDIVAVQGQLRAPVFSATEVPASYKANQRQLEHAGFMFYLKGEGIPNTHFAQGNKWYFNENGFWHSSFFWDEDQTTQY
jgi:hypothetical protein